MKHKPPISLETFVFLDVPACSFACLGHGLGVGPMFSTFIRSVYMLILEGIFLMIAVSVLSGAPAALLPDFRATAQPNKLIFPRDANPVRATRRGVAGGLCRLPVRQSGRADADERKGIHALLSSLLASGALQPGYLLRHETDPVRV